MIDSSSSFRAYRAALAEVEPPCIPYLYVNTLYTPLYIPHNTCMLIPCISHGIPVSLSNCLSRGLILQDLTFVHLGNPDMLMTPQGSKVNFSKRWQQFNILDTLRSYQHQSVTCSTIISTITTVLTTVIVALQYVLVYTHFLNNT